MCDVTAGYWAHLKPHNRGNVEGIPSYIRELYDKCFITWVDVDYGANIPHLQFTFITRNIVRKYNNVMLFEHSHSLPSRYSVCRD